MARDLVLEGSCHCGAVRFEVTEDFTTVRVCHCTTCKKLSGGVGTTNGRARSDAINVVAGRDLIRTYQPDEGSSKSFCSQCGSNLFGGGWPDSEECSVRISAIDSPFDRKPEGHTFVRSVAAWETLPEDGKPRYETSAQA
ncbi:MAG TPA: GFA family protein [Gaiellaceae bacterium]|nr:GFA family protein [Gaiellaceae bacterium]